MTIRKIIGAGDSCLGEMLGLRREDVARPRQAERYAAERLIDEDQALDLFS